MGIFDEYKVKRAFCKNAGKADKERDTGLSTPATIKRFNNIQYAYDKKWNLLDVYIPANTDKKIPVIINCHGGGFVYGTKEVYQYYCMSLAEQGFAVINFNYRLAPRHRFPAPIIDTNKVAKWMCQNADKYYFDLNNVFLIGDSAGAQIASQYATICTNSEYEKIMEIEVPDFTLRAVSLACGLYEIKPGKKTPTDDLHAIYISKKPEVHGEKLDVLKYVGSQFPPTFIFSAPGDFLVGNVEPMKKLLTEQGVECEDHIYGDNQTYHVFHCNIKSELATKTNQDQCEFFKRHIVSE